MENEKGYDFIKTDEIKTGKMFVSSKGLKYSKLGWVWRVGITVAVIALICISL